MRGREEVTRQTHKSYLFNLGNLETDGSKPSPAKRLLTEVTIQN